MSTTITVRNMDPRDKSWLKREAHRRGVSMEELVRHLIHKGRENTECRVKPSEAFKLYFGPEHGVELPPRGRYGYRPVKFVDEGEA